MKRPSSSKMHLSLMVFLIFGSLSAKAATFTVTSNLDTGVGTLRDAITQSNATTGPNTITFALPANSTMINLFSALPALTQPVVIDGTTQPNYANAPIVEISGGRLTGAGIEISAFNSTIRALAIHGFNGAGIQVNAGGAQIYGCQLGLGPLGGPKGNNYGILVGGGATIGGSQIQDRNVISANFIDGIRVQFGPAVIRGNYIGTDASGLTAVPNKYGVTFLNSSTGNRVGGLTPGEGNVISGNLAYGVQVLNSKDLDIFGNVIGLNANQSASLANSVGIYFEGSNFLRVGGEYAGAANVISGNGQGVIVGARSRQILITGNSIYNNTGGLGIDLLDDSGGSAGPTPNDALDADTGGNNLQNFPVIQSALPSGSSTQVTGMLSSQASSSYHISFYSNTSADSSGYGEGQTFIGATDVQTDASGNATFTVSLPALANNTWVTATASNCGNPCTVSGDTSEFSQAVQVTTNQPPVAANDSYQAKKKKLLVVPAPGVLANDMDPNGDSLTATLITGPAHGSLNLNSDGSFSYMPTGNFVGTDTFVYQASDGKGGMSSATVTITVKAGN